MKNDELTEDDLMDDENVRFVLTPWGCLSSVLTEYNVDVSRISGRVGQHIVDDFMDAMVRAGHVAKAERTEDE